MYLDRTKLRTFLYGLVGFYNADNPVYETLVPSLLGSRSGKYVNEEHPFLSVENLDQCIKNFSQFNYPAYSTSVRDSGGYTTGSKIGFQQKKYEYIAGSASDNLTPDPPDQSAWREIDVFSDFLIKAVYKGVDDMMDSWINSKKLRSKIKSIYDKVLLFNGVANYQNIEKNGNKLVGLRIRMKRGERSLVTLINRIGHHFDSQFTAGNEGTLEVFLFHSSQQEALFSFQLEHSKSKSFVWTEWDVDNNVMRYIDDAYDAGGDFYICYKQSELDSLGAQAYRMDLNWQDGGCGGCGTFNEFYKQYSPFIDVIGFEVDESSLGVGDTLFDPDDISISYTNNYGLNLNLTTKCDVGWMIEQEEGLVAEALSLSVARILMREIAFTTRKGNNIPNLIKDQARKELMEFNEAKGTLQDRWKASIKALEFDLSGLGEECFPCDDGKADVLLGVVTLR